MDTKQSIRKEVFKRRKEASPEQIEQASQAICEKILTLDAWKKKATGCSPIWILTGK